MRWGRSSWISKASWGQFITSWWWRVAEFRRRVVANSLRTVGDKLWLEFEQFNFVTLSTFCPKVVGDQQQQQQPLSQIVGRGRSSGSPPPLTTTSHRIVLVLFLCAYPGLIRGIRNSLHCSVLCGHAPLSCADKLMNHVGVNHTQEDETRKKEREL